MTKSALICNTQTDGKLFPFLNFNKRRFPELTMQDYLDLGGLMFHVNAQAVQGTFDVGETSRVYKVAGRLVVAARSWT